jgi:oligopeptidase B
MAELTPLVAPPIAPHKPHVHDRPTGPVDDPYHWLRRKDDPDTVAYLTAENAYADAWFAPHDELVEAIFGEIKSRIQETDQSVPTYKDGWWYVTRTEEGAQYAIHCRGESRETATSTLLLDENAEADGHEYFSVGAFDVSPSSQLLAWSLDVDGSEHFTMHVRDLATGVDLADEIRDTSWAGTAWSSDSRFVFYVTYDEQERPSTVWRHEIGTSQSDDVQVFHEPDERFYVGIDLTRSGEWIVIDSDSKTSSETWLIPATSPSTDPVVVRPRSTDLEYRLDHWGDRFVILTNLDAVDFRVMTAPASSPGIWSDFLPHVEGNRITRVDTFASHLVVHEWVDAQPRLRIVHRDGRVDVLDLGDAPHDVDLASNPEWNTDWLRFATESMISPATVWEHNVITGERNLLKRAPTPNVDLSRYTSARYWATSPDGTHVPYDVVRLAAPASPAPGPAVVYGYGSYEASMPPWFSVARLSLVDRGWTWVLAHPRGGGEMGRRWYLDGKLLNKRNTFDDTNAVADDLVARGLADGARLAVRGGSAGGLLVGACISLRPDRWAAAVAEVPFVDVVSTMSDPSLPLTVTEWEEWGDPRSEPYASYIASYSPYDNTTARAYPALFVTAGLNDPRVSYHEPAKWVARIRALRTDDAPLVLRTEMGAGHGGQSGRYEQWRDEARVCAFLHATIG